MKLQQHHVLWRFFTPGCHREKILGVGCAGIHRQRLGSQQELTGRHGDVLQVADDLDLVVFALKNKVMVCSLCGRELIKLL